MQSCGVPNISLLEHFSTALYHSCLSARLPAGAAVCSLQRMLRLKAGHCLLSIKWW